MLKVLRISIVILIFTVSITFSGNVVAQENTSDSVLHEATLENVVKYALEHQPAVQQALLDQRITEKNIQGRLADWYPQVNFVYNYQRNIQLQSSIIGGEVVRFGVNNTSAVQFNATQNLFNRDVLLASSTASKVRLQAEQNTVRTKIDMTVDVTKAFYDLLATQQQVRIGEEDIIRLQRSLKDAESQYAAGVADKTDFKRATIQLANGKALLKSNQELVKFKEEYLKTLIGYPRDQKLNILYDTLQMEEEVYLDTLQPLNYSEHIDYRILYTQRELQKANVKYNYWSFIPTLSAFGSYILNYQNNEFSELYSRDYPYSYVGASLNFPLFQGGKRIARIQEQKYTLKRIDYDLVNLKNNLSTEYTRAIAAYKSNLANYVALKDNVALATEVYDVVKLQYTSGVRPFLDVTIAETDLQTMRINYFNALYQVLASKMDVLRALGQIK
ncbi:TolC family protein [Chryseosolibacter indicus]|uniref:TolC family protein n=1 Tax=Chryseosolibacter indicus TaxID=2782351 RepID=A0ABS5VTG0_9BACT|nr:TolC family protein [Chryseosolibacter indicus]MBT1704501.1 TolC family protein [Chryseosolibacter indicus]